MQDETGDGTAGFVVQDDGTVATGIRAAAPRNQPMPPIQFERTGREPVVTVRADVQISRPMQQRDAMQ